MKKTDGRIYMTEGYIPRIAQRTATWERHGLIWRTLAVYEGLTVTSLQKKTGINRTTLDSNLQIMRALGAVDRDWSKNKGVWYALGVTEEWLQVLL